MHKHMTDEYWGCWNSLAKIGQVVYGLAAGYIMEKQNTIRFC